MQQSCSGKAISVTYLSVFLSVGIQHAKRMRHAACPTLQYFSTLSYKRYDFRNSVY